MVLCTKKMHKHVNNVLTKSNPNPNKKNSFVKIFDTHYYYNASVLSFFTIIYLLKNNSKKQNVVNFVMATYCTCSQVVIWGYAGF